MASDPPLSLRFRIQDDIIRELANHFPSVGRRKQNKHVDRSVFLSCYDNIPKHSSLLAFFIELMEFDADWAEEYRTGSKYPKAFVVDMLCATYTSLKEPDASVVRVQDRLCEFHRHRGSERRPSL